MRNFGKDGYSCMDQALVTLKKMGYPISIMGHIHPLYMIDSFEDLGIVKRYNFYGTVRKSYESPKTYNPGIRRITSYGAASFYKE